MLLQADASQLEWRTALELSQDWVGINEILEGEDTHSKNQQGFGLPSRLIAKIFLFRTIFRGSGWAFANDPDFMHVSSSASFWDDMNEKFYTKYNKLDETHKKWAALVMEGKPIEGPFGRSWLISNRDKLGNVKVPWTILSNYPVQGTGADVMTIARILAKNRIRSAGIPCKFRSTVHDSIVVDTNIKHLADLRDIFSKVFTDLPKVIKNIYGYNWVTPMACECKFGPNMKDMQKFA